MPWRVDAQFSAARQCQVREQAPRQALNRLALEASVPELRDERFDVIAHEVELVHAVRTRRMNGDLGGRQAEDQPAVADVHVRELQHVAQEGAIGLRLSAVDDRVGADDHGIHLFRAERTRYPTRER